MQERNFPDFISAYMKYAMDNYCPDQFHLWTGLSVIAGALERKVWVRQGLITHYPNIYALLVSHPGVGKSTAIDRGTDLIEGLVGTDQNFKIIPNQITEPALLDMMKIINIMTIGSTNVPYSAGYFYASEASASALQNLFGDFNACITALYDCPKIFRKKLKSDNQPTEIPNACFNVLAGSTFDYLKKLVNEESVMGGLASRFIYVICKDRIIREPKWNAEQRVDLQTRNALLQDLNQIHKLVGHFRATPGFIQRWEDWQPDFDRFLIKLNSPRMESLMARKSTNLMKICMLLSVSEGNSLELNETHWERGMQIVEDVTKDNAFVISSALMADKESQSGINQLIAQTLKKNGGVMNSRTLRMQVLTNGNDVSRVTQTLDFMLGAGWISSDGTNIKLLVDPDTNL